MAGQQERNSLLQCQQQKIPVLLSSMGRKVARELSSQSPQPSVLEMYLRRRGGKEDSHREQPGNVDNSGQAAHAEIRFKS